ncbi:MAG: hypothetical protein WBL21_07140 [Salinimicrobium sp.]
MEPDNYTTQDPPKLYSKTLILVFSLLFSPIFAAVLLMANLRSLGKNKARLQVLIFAVLYLIATGVVIAAFQLPPSLTLIANVIGAAILNEYFWKKHIGDIDFIKKDWIRPLLISMLIAMVVFFLLALAM